MKIHPITGEEKSLPIGSDGVSKDVFEKRLEFNLIEIVRKVNNKDQQNLPSYNFGPLLFYERKKSSGGVRRIYLPRLKDQIVFKWIHSKLIKAAEEKGITLQTPSPFYVVKEFRKELSLHENPVIVRTDISSFFDSIPRNRVIELANSMNLPEEVKHMLVKWSKNIIARPLWTTGKSKDEFVNGLPQGLSISATLAELWGSEIERMFSLRGIKIFRFVDDITFICKSEEVAKSLLKELKVIINEMGLSISKKKTHIDKLSNGIPWLGMIHYPDKILADPSRIDKWAKKFIFIRREVSMKYKADPKQDKNELLKLFTTKIKNEIKGKTSSRPQWYSLVEDNGQWKELDKLLHSQFKMLYKQLSISPEKNTNLPSIHKQIKSRREHYKNSSPR